ncbi:MAG: sarcosine oxidase subunit gamma family protein [Gemmatimonadota bacterium]
MADLPYSPPALVRQISGVVRRNVQLIPQPARSVISVRARGEALDRVAQQLGLESLPGPNRVAATSLGACLWVRPDEWLVIGEYAARQQAMAALEPAVGTDDGAVVDISASRVILELSGARARDVLASCCPLDLHPRVFTEGHCAQSVIGKAPILLQLVDRTPRWRIVVRPSLAAYVTSWLTDAMVGG